MLKACLCVCLGFWSTGVIVHNLYRHAVVVVVAVAFVVTSSRGVRRSTKCGLVALHSLLILLLCDFYERKDGIAK